MNTPASQSMWTNQMFWLDGNPYVDLSPYPWFNEMTSNGNAACMRRLTSNRIDDKSCVNGLNSIYGSACEFRCDGPGKFI